MCSNDTAIFNLLLSAASSIGIVKANRTNTEGEISRKSSQEDFDVTGSDVIFLRDHCGNTCLHLCVIYGLIDMYKHVMDEARKIIKRDLLMYYQKQTIEYREKHANTSSSGFVKNNLPNDNPIKNEVKNYLPNDNPIKNQAHGFSLKPDKVVLTYGRFSQESHIDSWLEHWTQRKLNERLVRVLNNELHSPLTLAASLIKENDGDSKMIEMFKFLIVQQTETHWEYGPMQYSLANLTGVDVPYNVEAYEKEKELEARLETVPMHGAISWICKHDVENAIKNVPVVKALIIAKWKECGYREFFWRWNYDLFIAVMVTFLSFIVSTGPTLDPRKSEEIAALVLYPFLLVTQILVFAINFKNSFSQMKIRISKVSFLPYICGRGGQEIRGVAIFDVFCRRLKLFAFIVLYFAQAFRTNNYYDESGNYKQLKNLEVEISLTIVLFVSWLHIFYYLLGFESTGKFGSHHQ